MSLFIAWTILLNYFLSKFFVVSLRFLCLVFVQDIDELFLIVVLLGTVFGTLESARIQKKIKEIEDLPKKKKNHFALIFFLSIIFF